MRAFAGTWPDPAFFQRVVGRLPWGQNIALLGVKDPTARRLFVPEHAGKKNFYLAALDDRDRGSGDNPSIGIILCRERNRVVVEYALRGVDAPIGVARYQLLASDTLPARLADALPTPDDFAEDLLRDAAADEA